jgi:hypothetical protein
VDARRVQEDELPVVGIQDSRDLVSRRLGLAARDGDLFAQDRIQERGFAHVGPSGDGDESRFKQV